MASASEGDEGLGKCSELKNYSSLLSHTRLPGKNTGVWRKVVLSQHPLHSDSPKEAGVINNKHVCHMGRGSAQACFSLFGLAAVDTMVNNPLSLMK